MDELPLSEELYYNILSWMMPKYARGTIYNRAVFLRKVFKTHNVLNKTTLRKIMRGLKYQHQRACISMINDYCYDNGIDFHIIVPSIRRQASKIPEILSPEEIKMIIKVAPKPYDLAIRCLFNMGAGLRISEIIKFKWEDIKWVDWLPNKENYGVALIRSSKGSKDRIVNIPKGLMNDLYNYAIETDKLNEFRIPVGGMIFDFGFSDINNEKKLKLSKTLKEDVSKGKEIYLRSRYNWFRYNILQKVCEKALNRHIKIHSLRHSRATYLYEVEKVPIEKIQVLLGHANLDTTRIYTKINPLSVFESIKNTTEI